MRAFRFCDSYLLSSAYSAELAPVTLVVMPQGITLLISFLAVCLVRADEDVRHCTKSSSWRLLQRADVLNDRLAPAVNVRPLAVADAVLVAGHIDHIALALRRGYSVVRLLVGDNDQAIVALLLVQAVDRRPQIS